MEEREVFILSPAPLERLGGMERFLQYMASGFEERGYKVRSFHAENCCPEKWKHAEPNRKLQSVIAAGLLGYYVGKKAKEAWHPGVKLVLSNSTAGWYPFGKEVRHAQFFHGTYRGQAKAVRPYISELGYLRLTWWDSMVLEKYSGKGSIALCCSEPIQQEIQKYFGYRAEVMWYPIDTKHFGKRDMGECRRKLGIDAESVGLFVGSVQPMKGFETVLHVAKKFPKTMMLMAVRGAVPEEAERLPNVRIFRDADYELLPVLYNAADFSLVPSRYDPFPFVVSEALSCGTAVIASPHGASLTYYKEPELQRFLVSATDDFAGFERAVQQVVDDPGAARELVERKVRPQLEAMMAPERWWPRFLRVVGMEGAAK